MVYRQMENGLIFVWTMFYIGFVTVETVKRENRCMRHYFVTTIKHPSKECDSKNVLMSRCEGHCRKSKTEPEISFSPVLYTPFRYTCQCCRQSLSIMKAVRLQCKDDNFVYATYRYILRCGCHHCHNKW
ncbi:Hypothetical predicted protein [Mytilus galloprovincialis]|uniref:CTCK domain-containing protein n=2 Tax=Mytilus galloprovincialis TaxID=29158 RepID=A0A8B6CQ21_MYTGA|nr:Hypothetical predicted protein [Mytilus galloprovincialis]